jgi:macrodomain Ter protein organizer (MatP/YcbG family)
METKKVRPLIFEIEEDVWEKFKFKTPRTITLNEAIVDLIKEDVRKNEPKRSFNRQ